MNLTSTLVPQAKPIKVRQPLILLVESNEDPLLYSAGHVPGAVEVDWTRDLPVYVLTNLAAVAYFRRTDRLHVVRHAVLPLFGAALMVVLLVEQILQQTDPPYTWFPWLIVAWIAVLGAVAVWLGARRPDALNLN